MDAPWKLLPHIPCPYRHFWYLSLCGPSGY